MNRYKKTMYEILEVSPDASDSEIRAAYVRLCDKVLSEKNDAIREESEFKLKVLDAAFDTLSIRKNRDEYDARLAARSMPVATRHGLVSSSSHADAVSLKAEAISLKAEAVLLKADAVALRAEVIALKTEGSGAYPVARSQRVLLPPLKRALIVVGGVIAVGMVLQVIYLLAVNYQVQQVAGEAKKAEEKVMLQQYYQETGVRAGSKMEVELLEAEKRHESQQQREQEERDRKYQQFVEESRRMGAQVSADLRRAEQEAKYEEQQRKREVEEERREREQEKRMKDEEERIRVEKEMERWRRLASESSEQ